MDSLLQLAYVEQRCNACGGRYRVTLHDVLMEHRLKGEWQPARPCVECAPENLDVVRVIPQELVERLEEAWKAVAEQASKAGMPLNLGG